VEVVRATRAGLPLEPLHALIGDAIAVGVLEPPDARRCGDVERAIEPEGAFGEHHLVGEDGALLEDPVAVRVLEPEDPVRPLHDLLLDLVVRPRGIGHVEAAELIEVGGDRPQDNGRRRGDLHVEARRRLDGMTLVHELARVCRERAKDDRAHAQLCRRVSHGTFQHPSAGG
jgi:hypothetical protein